MFDGTAFLRLKYHLRIFRSSAWAVSAFHSSTAVSSASLSSSASTVSNAIDFAFATDVAPATCGALAAAPGATFDLPFMF